MIPTKTKLALEFIQRELSKCLPCRHYGPGTDLNYDEQKLAAEAEKQLKRIDRAISVYLATRR